MKKHFVTGLVILLPLAVTLAVIIFLVNFLTKPFMGLVGAYLIKLPLFQEGLFFLTGPQTMQYGSKCVILILLFVCTVFLGMIGRWFFFHSLLRFGEFLLQKIPFVNKIYKTTQEVIRTIFSSNAQSFKQVVMVPFPSKESYSLALVTREAPRMVEELTDLDLISVFVPTTPNPTSGYLLMFPKKEIIFVDMKVEDAVKFVISCGVIHPPCTPSAPGVSREC